MSLAYLIIGILAALIIFAGDFYMLLMSSAMFFLDFLEWFTSSLDIGSSSNGYSFGGLIAVVGCVIFFCTLFMLVICIISFVLSKIPQISKALSFKVLIVLYSANCVLMLLASAMSISCAVWHTQQNDDIPGINIIVYVWAALSVLFWIAMTVLAVLNLVRMEKKLTDLNRDLRRC